MLKISAALIISLSLSACGGGAPAAQDNTAEASAALAQVAQNAAANYAAQHPTTAPSPAPAFAGAFTAINGTPNGYVTAPSKDALARGIAQTIANSPTSWPEYYRTLISDSGLLVTVYGEKIGTGNVSGLPIYAKDVVYTAKLTTNGLVVTGS